jgi:reactive intermediate/imine deaminase
VPDAGCRGKAICAAASRCSSRECAAWVAASDIRNRVSEYWIFELKESFMSDNPKPDANGITRYGAAGSAGGGGSHMPFSSAVAADGWLYVSGQVPMQDDGEIVDGGIVPQAHQAIKRLLAILKEAGYGPEHVVRCGVWLDDPRDFASFNKIFKSYFGQNPPARACVESRLVVDAKVEIDCVAYKKP